MKREDIRSKMIKRYMNTPKSALKSYNNAYNHLMSNALELKAKATSTNAELIMREILVKFFRNIPFSEQHPIIFPLIPKTYILDFYIPSKGICIEVDGRHHYEDNRVVEYDRERTARLNEINIDIYRFTNEELYTRKNDVIIILNEILNK